MNRFVLALALFFSCTTAPCLFAQRLVTIQADRSAVVEYRGPFGNLKTVTAVLKLDAEALAVFKHTSDVAVMLKQGTTFGQSLTPAALTIVDESDPKKVKVRIVRYGANQNEFFRIRYRLPNVATVRYTMIASENQPIANVTADIRIRNPTVEIWPRMVFEGASGTSIGPIGRGLSVLKFNSPVTTKQMLRTNHNLVATGNRHPSVRLKSDGWNFSSVRGPIVIRMKDREGAVPADRFDQFRAGDYEADLGTTSDVEVTRHEWTRNATLSDGALRYESLRSTTVHAASVWANADVYYVGGEGTWKPSPNSSQGKLIAAGGTFVESRTNAVSLQLDERATVESVEKMLEVVRKSAGQLPLSLSLGKLQRGLVSFRDGLARAKRKHDGIQTRIQRSLAAPPAAAVRSAAEIRIIDAEVNSLIAKRAAWEQYRKKKVRRYQELVRLLAPAP